MLDAGNASLAAIATAVGGTLNVALTNAPLATGAATAANQATANTSLASIATAVSGTLAVSGPLTNAQLSAAGLATSANQATANTSLSAIAASVAGGATAAGIAAVVTAVQSLASSSSYVLATPSDSTSLSATTRAITIGGAGNLTVKRPDGTTVGPIPVVAGQTLAIAALYIMATGTTATGILAQF